MPTPLAAPYDAGDLSAPGYRSLAADPTADRVVLSGGRAAGR